MAYLKPQSPLQDKSSGDYFYPLTTSDQVILDNGSRLSGSNFLSVEKNGANIGEPNTINADTLGGQLPEYYVNNDDLRALRNTLAEADSDTNSNLNLLYNTMKYLLNVSILNVSMGSSSSITLKVSNVTGKNPIFIFGTYNNYALFGIIAIPENLSECNGHIQFYETSSNSLKCVKLGITASGNDSEATLVINSGLINWSTLNFICCGGKLSLG